MKKIDFNSLFFILFCYFFYHINSKYTNLYDMCFVDNFVYLENLNFIELDNLKQSVISFMKKATSNIGQLIVSDSNSLKKACINTKSFFEYANKIDPVKNSYTYRDIFQKATFKLDKLLEHHKIFDETSGVLLPEAKDCLQTFDVSLRKNIDILKNTDISSDIYTVHRTNSNIYNIKKLLYDSQNTEVNSFLKSQYDAIGLSTSLDDYIIEITDLKVNKINDINEFQKKLGYDFITHSGENNFPLDDNEFRVFAQHVVVQSGDVHIIFTRNNSFYYAKCNTQLYNTYLAVDTYMSGVYVFLTETQAKINQANQMNNNNSDMIAFNNFPAVHEIHKLILSRNGEKIAEAIAKHINENPEIIFKRLHPELSSDEIDKIVKGHRI